jgi:CheY-like chemotaxis protein
MADTAAKKILIVEDDPDAAEALRILLESEGYETATAADARAGLAKVRAERPDLVMLDVMMPAGTEGFHLVWELRKDPDPSLRDVPIVVLTAIQKAVGLKLRPEAGDTDYQPGEFLPVQAFLDKTASSAELIATVKRVLAKGKASA